MVPPDDISALTRAAQEMLADAEALARSSDAVRAHVEAHFDIEGEARALVALYRRLLDEE